MKWLNPTILSIIPALAIIPVLILIGQGFHDGGSYLLIRVITSAFNPSKSILLLKSTWDGLQITVCIAFIGWLLSIILGFLLGLISSSVIWKILNGPKICAPLMRKILSIPRSIHEILWSLLLLQIMGLNGLVGILAILIPYSSLTARVISDQIDTIDIKSLRAIRQTGGNPFSIIITAILPKIIPLLISYGGYRLECSLRSATILGIFGFGGIGTDIQLSLQSLEFNEMWTSIWIIGIFIILLEHILGWYRRKFCFSPQAIRLILFSPIIGGIIFIACIIRLKQLDIDILVSPNFNSIYWPSINEIINAINELPLLNLTFSTLILTIFTSGIVIGIPAVGILLWPTRYGQIIQSSIWSIMRIIPPPLTALLLLLISTPGFAVAALALSIQNIGIMGRFLKEKIQTNGDKKLKAFQTYGVSKNSAWLYGCLVENSSSYLSYAAYRADVILRETAIVGLVGGTGLGWQLMESLSSFNWAEVLVLITIYSMLTISGEILSKEISNFWLLDKYKAYLQ